MPVRRGGQAARAGESCVISPSECLGPGQLRRPDPQLDRSVVGPHKRGDTAGSTSVHGESAPDLPFLVVSPRQLPVLVSSGRNRFLCGQSCGLGLGVTCPLPSSAVLPQQPGRCQAGAVAADLLLAQTGSVLGSFVLISTWQALSTHCGIELTCCFTAFFPCSD